ncbi:MauE/DoxX family redox-associated membrane protein [uncultured Chryseobacterium sp.]|uniref:DoxX family protein n=1 Tax=uncultured Chryseobacterium sp. TaxID=259322 RepID=UPI0025EB457B|nr:MauE/DoxX family redox-associated membrane protein [uncultured Chryseobacterium sp.]
MAYSKFILSFLLMVAGILHFVKPNIFIKIMPSYIPFHLQMVYISGIAEVLCGLLLIFPQTQKAGAYLSIFLFIGVFPANIEMAKKFYEVHHKYFWLTVARLPLQVVLIWWAYQFRK